MHYLNTTRHLDRPMSDDQERRLLTLLDDDIRPVAFTLPTMLSISFLLSTDRTTLQTFSGWATAAEVVAAEQSGQHGRNAQVIEELLGVTQPREMNGYAVLRSYRPEK